MKKHILTLLLAIVLSGCIETDLIEPNDELLFDVNGKSRVYAIPSLSESEPLIISVLDASQFESYADYVAVQSDSTKLYAIATLSINCNVFCPAMIPHFEELAQKYRDSGLEFVFLFRETDREAIENLEWLGEIKTIPVYYKADLLFRKELSGWSDPFFAFIGREKVYRSQLNGWVANDADEKQKKDVMKLLHYLTRDFCNANADICQAPPEDEFDEGYEWTHTRTSGKSGQTNYQIFELQDFFKLWKMHQ